MTEVVFAGGRNLSGGGRRARDGPGHLPGSLPVRNFVGKGFTLARRVWGVDATVFSVPDTSRVEAMGEFADFYASRKDAVLRAVLATTGDRSGAEAAVAEAFTRAYARWAQVAAHPSPTAWVVRTALNYYRSLWRRLRWERRSDRATAVGRVLGIAIRRS